MRRKILCLLVVVAFIASLLGAAVPVGQAAASVPGDLQWVQQDIPSGMGNVILNGSDVTEIAVTPANPSVVYVLDSHTSPSKIYRSNDVGGSFAPANVPVGALLYSLNVAPDNANVLAVTDRTTVFISTDGGISWNSPRAIPPDSTGAYVMSVVVGPANSSMLLGRKYAIALSDPVAGSTTRGHVMVLVNGTTPGTLAWSGGGTQVKGLRDYVNVKFTPNSDDFVVALGVTAAPGSAAVQVINMATKSVISTAVLAPAGTMTDYVDPPASTAISSGAIQLPSDFDATTSSGRRGYASLRSGPGGTPPSADNDVYRFDDTIATALSAGVGRVTGISYSGTIMNGTLFAGAASSALVKYTTTMASSSTTWTTTQKLLPANTINTRVRAAADFATSNRVFVSTTGFESAFSVSTDGGISFNQRSLIDTGAAANNLNRLTGLVLTSDGKTVFLGSTASGNINLWTSPTPVTATSWHRIFVAPGTTGAVTLSPDYATTSTLYFFDLAAGGNIYRSSNGGATFNTRLGPTYTYAISSWVFQDANIGYVTDLAGNIFKTTDGALSWTGPVSAGVGSVRSLVVGKPNNLIVGGTGMIAYSNDGGTTFTTIAGNAGESYRIARDPSFASNNAIYLGDASSPVAVTGKTYRLVIGTDPSPVDLLAPNAGTPVISLSLRSGVLYSFHATLVDRTLSPAGTAGPTYWRTMDTPLLVDMSVGATVTDVNPVIYVRNSATGNPQLWAYSDTLAIPKPVLTSPASGATVEPGQLVTLAWNGMGSGTGQVTAYQVQIKDAALPGWGGATASNDIPVANPASPSITMGAGGDFVFTLLPGKQYQWRVRASNEVSGDRINSNWSDPFTLAVNKLVATITLSNLNQVYDGTPKSAAVTTTPLGLAVTLTYNGSLTPPTNVGSYAVVATVNDPTYQGSAGGTLEIAKADQTITFGALANKTYGDPDFTVSATASSGLPVTFTASGACTVSGNTVHITGLGSCTVTASQDGNANYNAAPPVSQSFTVNITYDRLRYLVDEYVTKKGIVNSLSAKLDAAEAAQARGDLEAKAGIIGAFINEVEAQTSKSISQEDAAILIALVRAL